MLKKKSKIELDDAICTCYRYIFQNVEKTETSKSNIFDFLDSIENDKISSYVHHYPYNLLLKLTSNCNLRCKHCFFYDNTDAYDTNDELCEEKLFGYLRYFVEEVNILRCSFTGGEVFTSPYIFKFIEYLKSKNVFVELLTNATLITEETAEQLSKILNKKTDSIQVSLDGLTEDINDEVRGQGVFKKVIRNIEYLTNRGLNVQIAFTINSKNVNQLEGMYDLCKHLNVRQLNVGRFLLSHASQEYLVPNLDDIFINIAKLLCKFEKDKKVRIKMRCLKAFDFLNYEAGIKLLDQKMKEKHYDFPKYLSCHPRHELFSLYPNGDISLCYNCDAEDLCIGNLEKSSFDEIWIDRFSKSIFQKRNIENLVCKHCKYVPLCNGGCPANAYWKYKTTKAPDSCCNYAQELMKKVKDERMYANGQSD